MNYRQNERFIILLASAAFVGLTIESIILKWEFWVPPLIIAGVISMWAMYLSARADYGIRRVYYFVLAMLALFFYGVHEEALSGLSVVAAFIMALYAFFDRIYMMNLLLLEYIVLMIIQFVLRGDRTGGAPVLTYIIGNLLHAALVMMVYICCVKVIRIRAEALMTDEQKNKRIEAYDADMEDFLSNISHELRTPVNVVNGMSDLLIKSGVGYEANSIKEAGIRLAYQIEDIQDYTECKRQKLVLEENDYMSTSLINDVVTGFRSMDNTEKLELVVDMDPKVPEMMRGDVKKLHKIFRHLLSNAVKFTRVGGIYIRLTAEETDQGVNLCIEVTDTGIGMDWQAVQAVSEGMFQADKSRDRSSGGIGIGLFIVYGFAHRMGGFVKVESKKSKGTTIRVTIPQTVVNPAPCLALSRTFEGDILFHVRPEKYKVPRVREFYRSMATTLATGVRVPLYSADTVYEVERLREKLKVTHIFMGQEEYEENRGYFDAIGKEDITIAVSAAQDFKPGPDSQVIVMPKPLYAYPVIKILNEGRDARDIEISDSMTKPVLKGIKALIVDDEPMNLVVATGLFKDYEMLIDTAESGREAINLYRANAYDVVFMDHMMPEMDGVEAMKLIKREAEEAGREVAVIALTANAVSGAREMFIEEGFDGFIAKPINMADFDRLLLRVFPDSGL